MKQDAIHFWLLCSLLGVSAISFSMLQPLVPLFAHSLGGSTAVVGALVATTFLLPFLLAMPLGNLIDQWGPRGLITAGAAALAVAPLTVTLSPTFLVLFVSQALDGLAQVTLVVSAQALVGAYAGGANSERSFGWYTTFLSAGQFLGPLSIGFFVDAFTYRGGFAVAGALGAVVAIGSRWLAVGEAPPSSKGPSRALVRFGDVAELVTPRAIVAILVSFVVLLSLGAYTALLPVYLARFAYSATVIGVLVSLRPLTGLILRPLLPNILDALGGRTVAIAAIGASIGVGMGLIAIGHAAAILILASIIIGGGWAISQPLSMAMTVEATPQRRRGLGLGLRLAASRAAQFVSPLIFGLVAQVSTFDTAFAASAVLAVALSLVVAGLHARFA